MYSKTPKKRLNKPIIGKRKYFKHDFSFKWDTSKKAFLLVSSSEARIWSYINFILKNKANLHLNFFFHFC